ncbi:hypothetical protein Taro_040971 [Colocasia esculenta]|uniref:Uncharacterized protein n=1 Tax=Colocasia esculenta TaxID=4460 RepID=A0A843WKC2_COLES|nr:hypothetical protein [Colocasia esculenta]
MTFLSVICCPNLHGGYSLAVPSFRGRRWSGLVRTRASSGFRFGVQLPCKFRVRTAVCCSCFCIACVASVVARRVRAVVVWLMVESLAVVFLYEGRLQASPGAVLLVIFGAFECVCVAKAERACVWRGLHRCRSVWVLSVKVWCAWLCVWLLRWPACLVSRFQVSRLRWWDCVSPWPGCSCCSGR